MVVMSLSKHLFSICYLGVNTPARNNSEIKNVKIFVRSTILFTFAPQLDE